MKIVIGVLFCGMLLCQKSLLAEVRTVVRSDGTKYMYNSGRARPSRKEAARVTEIPQQRLETLIDRYSRHSELDPKLVRAVIQVESAFNPDALSQKGAMGLMQLMPGTASDLAVQDPYDPEQNLRAGTDYLRQMLDVFDERLELALAAYNAGPEAVERYGGIPPYPETRGYVEKVMRLYKGNPAYSLASSRKIGRGRRTYLRRDANGQWVMSTSPSEGR
jgi:soluble lytic murein transglycosylase-like protein